jgi:hypothetical protein
MAVKVLRFLGTLSFREWLSLPFLLVLLLCLTAWAMIANPTLD